MTCSLRFDFLVISSATIVWLDTVLGGATDGAALGASPTSHNHTDINGVVLVRNIEAGGSHYIDISVHGQVLRQHILFLNNDFLIIELNWGCLKGGLLRQYRRLCWPAIFHSTSMPTSDTWIGASLAEVLGMRWVDQGWLLVYQLLIVFAIAICVKLC